MVEELLKGQELSVIALVSGHTIYVLETAQDHKPIGEGDTGPNTGGMGAYSPAPIGTPNVMAKVEREILVPIVDALRNDGAPFQGALYAGLMLTAAGPKVLEFNCRFGDPETQAILMRLRSDLAELLCACVDDRLEEGGGGLGSAPGGVRGDGGRGLSRQVRNRQGLQGLDRVAELPDTRVYHGGTQRLEHLTVTAGGRVLGVTALGADLAQAQQRAYEAVEAITFDNANFRRGYRRQGVTRRDRQRRLKRQPTGAAARETWVG